MKSRPWSDEDVAILREEMDAGRGWAKRAARRLDRSNDAVKIKSYTLRTSAVSKPNRPGTFAELTERLGIPEARKRA